MNDTNLSRMADALRERGCDAALLTNPWTITWLTGYAPPIQIGPSPFEGGPALAWWQHGQLTLITSDMEAAAAREVDAEVAEYAGYTIDQPLNVVVRQADVLAEVLAEAKAGQRIAVETNFLPAPLLQATLDAVETAVLIPCDGAFDLLRAVKTPLEIDLLRASLSLCDRSQAVVKTALRPGISEIELWGHLKAQLEIAAGGRLPILADLVGGARTGDIGGLPGEYVLAEGDAVIADIVPRLNGYWGDICGTHFVSEPPAELRKIYGIVRDALRRGIDAVKPGVRACDLDALLRNAIRDAGYEPFPHHAGHGLGASFHEQPRIVPYNELPLAENMVIALEPGIYLPGIGGVRLEDVVLVTADGCDLLTSHLS
jgi:Xaa-Pro dipeptidase